MDSSNIVTGTVAGAFRTASLPLISLEYLSPINLTLAVYILIQNSMIIYHYYRDRRRLSSFLFILIAVTDIGTACIEIGRATIALLCLNNRYLPKPDCLDVVWFKFGILSFVTSTFFGMVLAIVKTIKIINPFYTIRLRTLMICLTLFPFLGLVLSVGDSYTLCEQSGRELHVARLGLV